jgi:isopenicillin-N N-acyltransferase-like protein
VKNRPIRVLQLEGDPFDRGAAHGAAYHNEIRRYTAERVRLSVNGSWAGRVATGADAIDLAQSMLPAHQEYAPDLYEELDGLARSSGISLAEAVIVGGFTDFVDAIRARGAGPGLEEDDCTAVLVPPEATGGDGLFGQTWDMHDSATEHVTLLRIISSTGTSALIFSTVGCLGQIGLNSAGIVVGINNLVASNGGVGVTWPFVVRKVLQQTDLEAAVECVMKAELAGAHNYLLMDRNGRGYNIEAMPAYRAVTRLGDDPLVHTNHCLDQKARETEAARPPDLLASSEARLAKATELMKGRPVKVEDLIALTREPEVICRRSAPPHHNESSGAAIMRPATREFWACWGVPADNDFESFKV